MSEEFEPEVFSRMTLRCKVIKVIDKMLIPTNIKLIADIIPEEDEEIADYLILGALTKIKFWFEQIVDKAVIFNRGNDWALNSFVDSTGMQILENNIMLLPYDPTDEILAQVFQSKMNALGNSHIMFGPIEIITDNPTGISFLFAGDGEINLPPMTEWVGERSYFKDPWWCRNDASMLDIVPTSEADLSEIPPFAKNLDFIIDALRPSDTPVAGVIRPTFKPEIIHGGKQD
jgi:hypothetical protein